MDNAIYGFLGVIIGAIIVAGSDYLIAVRREEVKHKREIRNRAIEIKRGARMIDVDLARAQASAIICIEKRHWWSVDISPLNIDGWQNYRTIIASELTNEAWNHLLVGVEAVENLITARSIGIESGIVTIPDSIADQIAPMLNDINAGRTVLATFLLDQPLQH